jgi:hypothetical protein
MKAILARFGIRSFKPTLRKAAEKLDGLWTAEGTPLLENTRAELSRHLARLRVVRDSEAVLPSRRHSACSLNQSPNQRPNKIRSLNPRSCCPRPIRDQGV